MLRPLPLDKMKPTSYQSRQTRFIDQGFQLKYTFLITGIVLAALLSVFVPLYYFLQENYAIFIDIAYEYAPNMVKHLEREMGAIYLLSTIAFLGGGIFFFTMGLKVTSKIIAPIHIVKNHLRSLSRGHWFERPVHIRDTDEFHELVDAYNYFYISFQKNIERDLKKLEAMHIDPADRDSYFAWRELIQEKRSQLNVVADEPATPAKFEEPA